MKKCETCLHWLPIDLNDPYDTVRVSADEDGFTSSDDPPAPGRWGYCNQVSEFSPRSTSDKFYVQDGSMYKAKLGTRHDFGCTEHEGM